jgi:hypothetical protein
MRYHVTIVRMLILKKIKKITNIGEDVEKKEFSYIVYNDL